MGQTADASGLGQISQSAACFDHLRGEGSRRDETTAVGCRYHPNVNTYFRSPERRSVRPSTVRASRMRVTQNLLLSDKSSDAHIGHLELARNVSACRQRLPFDW